jgi:alpha-tubulin suppressor-like RCC1 family protein
MHRNKPTLVAALGSSDTTATMGSSDTTAAMGSSGVVVVQAAGGAAHTIILCRAESGSGSASGSCVYACGRGMEGQQLGLSTPSPGDRPSSSLTPTLTPTPIVALALQHITSVACAANGNFSAALGADGHLWTWGANDK